MARPPLTPAQVADFGVRAAAVATVYAAAHAIGPSEPVNPNQELIFPLDLIRDDRNYYISIKFMKYQKRSMKESTKIIQGSGNGIRLPLPTQLVDSKSVAYDTTELGSFMGAVVDSSIDIRNNINGILRGDVGVLGAAGLNIAGGAAAAIAADTLSRGPRSVGQNAFNAIQASHGIAFNPYQTVLFKHPNFREHSFSWRMAARNEKESMVIKDIIQSLQTNMLPDVAGSLIFQYPSILAIRLFPTDEYLYQFKPCVLTSVTANYAPQSTPAFYKKSAAPAVVDLTIKLKEIEIWTRLDYTKSNIPIPNQQRASPAIAPNANQFVPPRGGEVIE